MIPIYKSQLPKRNRKKIFVGDEATVSLINSNTIERLQSKKRKNDLSITDFHLSGFNGNIYIDSKVVTYQLIRFVSLRISKKLYPNYFVNCEKLIIGKSHLASYSQYVPDENGTIKRKAKAMKEFKKSGFVDFSIREKSDSIERTIVPQLGTYEELFQLSGIELIHPEVNYHYSKGNCVFFEIIGLDASKILSVADQKTDEILEDLAFIYTLAFRYLSNRFIKEQLKSKEQNLLQLNNEYRFLTIPIDTLYSFILEELSSISGRIYFQNFVYSRIKKLAPIKPIRSNISISNEMKDVLEISDPIVNDV